MRGLYYLGRYSATTHKFQTTMMRKIIKSIRHHEEPDLSDAEDWLQNVIKDFTRLGYLNDAAYSQSYIRSMRDKGYSARKMSQKLKEKGIDDFESSLSLLDELSQLLTFLKRKRLGVFSSKPFVQEKLLATLARNGFSYNLCQNALAMSAQDIELYLSEQKE